MYKATYIKDGQKREATVFTNDYNKLDQIGQYNGEILIGIRPAEDHEVEAFKRSLN